MKNLRKITEEILALDGGKFQLTINKTNLLKDIPDVSEDLTYPVVHNKQTKKLF